MASDHTVCQGECLSSIAKKYGFVSYKAIYNHPLNDKFRKKRPDPNLIYPGDVIHIPDKQPKEESCDSNLSHRFTLARAKVELKIVIKDSHGDVIADTPYELELAGLTFKGKTDKKGLLQRDIPIGTQTATLYLKDLGIRWNLEIGHLNPVHDHDDDDSVIISGIQGRLNNLGFPCGSVDGLMGPKTKAALKAFQKKVLGRKDPDGEPDKQTRDALVSEHLC
jgi:Putative peptidoglycan binding domain/LysM domain